LSAVIFTIFLRFGGSLILEALDVTDEVGVGEWEMGRLLNLLMTSKRTVARSLIPALSMIKVDGQTAWSGSVQCAMECQAMSRDCN
jgi:hypothetical protein